MVVKSDGSVWFTDPVFGILGYYEGDKAEPELPPAVYRIDGQTGEAERAWRTMFDGPNGLAFSPDESILYVVASRAAAEPADPALRRGRTARSWRKQRVFIDAGPGTPDGFRVDIDGNLWCGWGMGDAGTGRRARVQPGGASDRPHRACRNAAPICASADAGATGCSWRRATASMRCM